jgi:hypothetical protein
VVVLGDREVNVGWCSGRSARRWRRSKAPGEGQSRCRPPRGHGGASAPLAAPAPRAIPWRSVRASSTRRGRPIPPPSAAPTSPPCSWACCAIPQDQPDGGAALSRRATMPPSSLAENRQRDGRSSRWSVHASLLPWWKSTVNWSRPAAGQAPVELKAPAARAEIDTVSSARLAPVAARSWPLRSMSRASWRRTRRGKSSGPC